MVLGESWAIDSIFFQSRGREVWSNAQWGDLNILFSLKIWVRFLQSKKVIILCDNKGAVSAIKEDTGRAYYMALSY
jgi:hypothetical protein